MARFDAMQSNHPQANAPWAGQTVASGPGDGQGGAARRRFAGVDRGAPLVALLVLLLAVGVWVALAGLGLVARITVYPTIYLVVMILFAVVGRLWATRLWNTRWQQAERRGVWPEGLAFVISFCAFIASALLLQVEPPPWVFVTLLGIQVAPVGVIAPMTLRRYPGLW